MIASRSPAGSAHTQHGGIAGGDGSYSQNDGLSAKKESPKQDTIYLGLDVFSPSFLTNQFSKESI